MSESTHQRKLIQQLEKAGWYVLRLIKTNKNGIPDLLALKEGETPFFIEVKGENGKPSKLQEYRIKELNDNGFKAIINYEPNTNIID